MPQLPQKAIQLLNVGAVHIESVVDGNVAARVQDHDRATGPYFADVVRAGGTWSCSCKYHSPGTACVHIAAVAVVTDPI